MVKKGKAASPTGIMSEMSMADEDCSAECLTSLCNLIIAQGRIPDDWNSSILLPVFKGKGDPMECGSYSVMKLLEHAMKVTASIICVFEQRIRENGEGRAMQFGFMPRKGTTDAVLTVRQQKRNVGVKERSATLLL